MRASALRLPSVPLSASFLVFLCTLMPAYPQVDTGGIRGTVKDTSGAVVSGAKVTLSSEGTGLTMETVTSGVGDYSFTPVKIGLYDIAVASQGFRTATQRHVSVEVQQQVKADFTLLPGAATEAVEVTAVSPLLQTQEASVGMVASEVQINNLPLNGRNYTFLAQLGPGVSNLNPTRGLDKTGSFVANGLTTVHNSYILDGIDNNNDTVDFLNGAAYVNLPPPDAIQEFKVQTSNFNAEFGRAGGAVVNATIKSGTNQFHGSAWEFVRNDLFDATNQYFTNPKLKKGKLRQNQFGVAVGGPILKRKTFFFADYDGTRIRQDALRQPDVPTAVQRGSGFTDFRDLFSFISGTKQDLLGRTFSAPTIFDPATTRKVTAGTPDPVTGLVATGSGFVRDPFYTQGSVAGITDFTSTSLQQFLNQLPANRLNPNAIKLLQLYPAPNQPGIRKNFAANYSQPDDVNHFDARVDQNFSQRDQLFGRYSYSNRQANVPGNFTGPGNDSGFGQGAISDKSVNLAVSETHSFSNSMINELRVGYSRLRTSEQLPLANTSGIPAQFGIQGIPQGEENGGLPNLGIDGLTALGPGGFASPNRRSSDTLQFTENLTKIHGAHSFKGGFEYQSVSFPWIDPAWSRGRFDFSGYSGIPNVTNGVGMADFLLTPVPATVPNGVDFVGGPNSVFASNITKPDDLRHYYGAYFQDDWKATPKLTLNLGLRWEVFGQIQEAAGRQGSLVPGSPSGAGAQYLLLSSQKNTPLSPSFTSLLAKDGIQLRYLDDSSISTTPLNNFAPRLGVAYQFDPRIVVRAGYGIFYGGFENLGGAPDPGYTYPFAVNLAFFRPNSVSPLVYPNGQRATLEGGLLSANPDPSSPNFNAKGLGLFGYQTPWKTAYTQQWNLALEFAVTPNQSITLAYVGNNSRHLLNGDKRNIPSQILPPGTDQSKYIPFPDFGRNSDYVASNGDANYHSLQTSYERRLSQGLQMLVNYTWSKCRTDNKNILGLGEGDFARAPLLPGFGIKRDYHFCGNDVPHVFHASGIWQLPVGRGQLLGAGVGGVVNQIIGGWSTNWILTVQDGFPFTVGCATATTAGFGCSPLLTGQNIYSHLGPHGISQFLNPAAFTNPPVATAIGQSDYSPLGGGFFQAHGPGYTNLDFSVFKQFSVTETMHLEFRSEFFNLLNHPNFSNGFKGLNFTDPKNFGVVNGTRGNARQVQFALKFYY